MWPRAHPAPPHFRFRGGVAGSSSAMRAALRRAAPPWWRPQMENISRHRLGGKWETKRRGGDGRRGRAEGVALTPPAPRSPAPYLTAASIIHRISRRAHRDTIMLAWREVARGACRYDARTAGPAQPQSAPRNATPRHAASGDTCQRGWKPSSRDAGPERGQTQGVTARRHSPPPTAEPGRAYPPDSCGPRPGLGRPRPWTARPWRTPRHRIPQRGQGWIGPPARTECQRLQPSSLEPSTQATGRPVLRSVSLAGMRPMSPAQPGPRVEG